MPHTFLKQAKSNLPEYAVAVLGQAKALLITRVFSIVNEILDRLSNECPPPAVLKVLLKKIDAVESAVQAVEKNIRKVEKLPPLLDGSIIIAKIYLDIQYHLRPDYVSALFSKHPFTFLNPIAVKKLNNLQKRIRTTEEVLEDLETAKRTITLAVAATRGALGPVLGIIQVIKSLIEACFNKQDLTDEERKALIEDIQGKTDELLTQGISYKNEKGTTYTIKVITDPNSPSIAPRRQAIAIDFRGITVLTGPSSFASSTQILIEELKFRIDNQLP